MTYYLKNGSSYRVTTKESLDLHDKLPPGNYTVGQDPFGNLFLDRIEDFDIPSKLYGNTTKHTNRIINSFFDRTSQTGVLLNGEKGSGKTLLAKNVCSELAKQGVPTIVINATWTDEKFFKLMQDIEQPCVIFFDEFEKIYTDKDQEKILTLLDGVFNSKKLYILTVNDKWKVNNHMRNRPGRIFYLLDFKGLDQQFIREYCQDRLNDKKHIDQICSLSSLYGEFNFDMLKSLVEEMNRYNESPTDSLEMLNAKPEYDSGANYDMKLIVNGKEINKDDIDGSVYHGSPLAKNGVHVSYDADPDDHNSGWKNLIFNPEHLVKLNSEKGEFIFEVNDAKLILSRIAAKKNFDYTLLF